MIKYYFRVNNDRLSLQNQESAYTGNTNTYECQFDFTGWDNFPGKVAVFNNYITVIGADSKAVIPAEALESTEYLKIGVYGVNTESEGTDSPEASVPVKRISTNVVNVRVDTGAYTEGITPEDPASDVWDNIVAMVGGFSNQIQEIQNELSQKVDKVEKMGLASVVDEVGLDMKPCVALKTTNGLNGNDTEIKIYTKSQVDSMINSGGGSVDLSDYYDKDETNAMLGDKVSKKGGYGLSKITGGTTQNTVQVAVINEDGTIDSADVQLPGGTLAEYGITNAYTKSEVDSMISSAGGGGSEDQSNLVNKSLYYYGDENIVPTNEIYFNITEDGAISRNPDVWDDFVVTDVVIPYEVNGVKVTKIADRGFGKLEDSSPPILTNVIMPNTITSIGNYAFSYCYLLDNIVIPDGVTYIGYDAFYNCNNLHHTVIPKSVNYLGLSAFEGAGLYTVTYKGSKSQWDNIEISERNEPLLNSNITFEGNLATEPTVEVNNIDTQIIYNFSEKNNTDTRIIANSLISISFYLDADISDDSNHISSLSFDTSDTAPNIDYPGSGVINWIGTGCSISEGQSVFIPEPNKTYDIVFYYNGRHMVGMVNGYTPVVSKTTNEVSA